MKRSWNHPIRQTRRAAITGLLLLLLLTGAAVGWHFWQLDASRNADQILSFEQSIIDGAMIGGAALLGSGIWLGLVLSAQRRARRPLEQLASAVETGATPPASSADPAVAALSAAVGTLREQAVATRQTREQKSTAHDEEFSATRATLAVMRVLNRTLELEPLLSEFCQTIAVEFNLRMAAVALFNEQGLMLRFGVARARSGPGEPLAPFQIADEGGLAGEVISTRQPATRRQPPYDSLLRAPGKPAFQLAYPLFSASQLSGMLLIQSDVQPGPATEQSLLQLGEHLGTVLVNAQSYSAARERASNILAINELARLISSSLDMTQVLGTALQQIRQLVPYDQASVTLYDSDRNQFEVAAASDAVEGSLPTGHTFSGQSTPLRTAFEAGHPVSITHLDDPELMASLEPLSADTHSLLVLPLTTSAVRLGTLNLANRQEAAFTDSHISLLTGLSHFLTTALANARLYQQRAQAIQELEDTQTHLLLVEKLRALGELAGGVTHDFNNLLAGIIGNVQLLQMEVDDAEQRETLALIEKAAKDGAATVKRIQGFARNDGDQPDAPVDILALADDAIDLTRLRWRNAAQEQNIRIELLRELHPVPIIRGHAPELREVLTNLIINAVDAMPHGGTLRIATGQRSAEVFISVADTGVGMSEDVQARIFNPFFTTKGQQGNGLGLAVSAAIVQRHGGRIEVQSIEGRGTNFVIWLPILEVDLDDLEASDEEIPNIYGRMLIVEDEALVRLALGRMFAAWGHRVTSAETGRGALDVFRPGTIDIVICDLGLPDMVGWDVLRQLRDRDPAIRTLLLTGWGRQIDPAEARLRGADLVITKPFDQATLRRIIAHMLDGSLDMTPRIIG